MALENLDTAMITHDLVQDLKWDAELRQEFQDDRSGVLDRYDLPPAERRAIEEGDFGTLYDLGMHPYLGAQFARIVFADNKEGATSAVEALLASIRRERTPKGAKR